MASAASEIDPSVSVAPHIVVEESSRAGGSREEALPEAAVVEAVVDTEPADGKEEGQCGLFLYMEAGGCKEAFVSWAECVQAAEKEGSDMVDRCSQATIDLKKCMDAHADYYALVLQAEQTVSGKAEAAIAADTADTNKNKGEESAPSPDTDETKMEEALVESAATTADEKEVVVQQEATPSTAAEGVKEESIVEKAESLSLGN